MEQLRDMIVTNLRECKNLVDLAFKQSYLLGYIDALNQCKLINEGEYNEIRSIINDWLLK